MNLNPFRKKVEERDSYPMTLQQYGELVSFNNNYYNLNSPQQTWSRGDREEIGSDYSGFAAHAMKGNGVVFSCMNVRMSHFSEARFCFRKLTDGRPGELTGRPQTYLDILNTPWPGATTGDLLARMIQDVDLAGNFYGVRTGGRIARLRPDWVAILLGSTSRREYWVAGDPDTEVAGYMYFPGGPSSGADPLTFFPEDVCHFAPLPDPLAYFRGMSWLTPLVREIQGDSMMSTHKNKFLENGATPNMVVKLPEVSRENFREFVETVKSGHEGAANAYKTLFLGGGADATVVGANFQQLDFKTVQGAGETRIAAAAGTPPVIVGLSEGLQGSSLNTGNYQAARRRFADGTLRPLWRNAAGSLARIIQIPTGSELWYDDRDIAFLQEDMKDRAEIQQLQTISLKTLIDAGFQSDSAVEAIISGDFQRLSHTGLFSVQLQPAGQLGEGKGALVSGTIVPNNGSSASTAVAT